MRRLLVAVAAVATLLAPASAGAHPLGNFTVNRYVEVRVSGADAYVRYVLDLAEIPTVQLRDRVRGARFVHEVGRDIELRVDGRRVALSPIDNTLRERRGAGGLETLRFEAVYSAGRAGRSLAVRDRNFDSRIGWREVVVSADRGARIERSTAPSVSASRALSAYPRALLSSPPAVSAGEARVTPGAGPGRPPRLGAAPPPERESSGLESLVSGDLTPGFVLASLLLAVFWGAAHAFSPGHGKAIVAGYLVGSRGTARHAVLLGAVVTITHTIGVFALGVTTLALAEFIVPERLYPWLNLVAALLVVGVGIAILRMRVGEWLHTRAHARARAHSHHRHHGDHHHHHDHHHAPRGGSVRSLIGVGVSAGIVPCPTALVVLLAAISLHRVGYGLVLILAFSVGLAASITGIGLAAVWAKRAFGRMTLNGPLVRALPAVSAVVVLALGLAMTVRALPDVL